MNQTDSNLLGGDLTTKKISSSCKATFAQKNSVFFEEKPQSITLEACQK